MTPSPLVSDLHALSCQSGARSWGISDRMSANIFHDTATSAIRRGDVTPFVRDATKRSSVRAVATARCKTSLAVNHFSPASFTGNDDLRQRETRTRKQQCHLLTSSGSRDRKSSSPFRIAQRACCSPRHEAVAARLSARVPNYDRHPVHAGSFQSGPALLSTPMSDRGAFRHVR
jgi:hypothetical protein